MQTIPTDAFTLYLDPSSEDVRQTFPTHLSEKILRHLDPETGDPARGEIRCDGIASIVSNPWSLEVFYRTTRPDGSKGTQFMRFYPWTAVMRCLPVTTDGRVVMIQEYRRGRGEWIQMLPAGGVKQGKLMQAVLTELLEEAGCRPTARSRFHHLGARYMDDGIFHDKLDLVAVDGLEAPKSHSNPEESIKGIVLVHWNTWLEHLRIGAYDDIYCSIFSDRCKLVGGRLKVRNGTEL